MPGACSLFAMLINHPVVLPERQDRMTHGRKRCEKAYRKTLARWCLRDGICIPDDTDELAVNDLVVTAWLPTFTSAFLLLEIALFVCENIEDLEILCKTFVDIRRKAPQIPPGGAVSTIDITADLHLTCIARI